MCSFIKNEALAQVFSCEFWKIRKNTFFAEHHQTTASDYSSITPSIETHLAAVRGLPTKKFLPQCVNEKSSTERRS